MSSSFIYLVIILEIDVNIRFSMGFLKNDRVREGVGWGEGKRDRGLEGERERAKKSI